MNKSIVVTAFLLGAMAILWMAGIFTGANTLALIITLVIGGVYLLGFLELRHYRRATASLSNALSSLTQPVEDLPQWVQQLHPVLRTPVQARIEGERAALPAPVLTPYLVGLLVMLGLLGTFVGMVDTLRGSVIALQQASDIQAMREGLAAPISGLSLAFGTSVAGVAASAMLGLVLTLSRRERIQQAQRLDRRIATHFRHFSLVHNRQQTYQALQAQAGALPEVASQMTAMGEQLAQMGEQLSATLTTNQTAFQEAIAQRFQQLADTVESSLQTTIEQSGRQAALSIAPIMQDAAEQIRDQITGNTTTLHRHLEHSAEQHLQTVSDRFAESLDNWRQQLSSADSARLENFTQYLREAQAQTREQQAASAQSFKRELEDIAAQQKQLSTTLLEETGRLLERSDKLIEARTASEATWLQQQADKMDALTASLQTGLSALRDEEQQRGDAAVNRLAELEAAVSTHLAKLGTELEAPMARLIETASETPRAAAEVITQLRAEISNNIERDNQLLAERQTLMEQLNTLASALEQSSGNYNTILEQLVDRSANTLKEVAAGFDSKIDSETQKLSDITAQFAVGASEMASLSEAFGTAVQHFNESNTQLVDTLCHIEQSLEQSSLRSDEQLGYYVAQAREIIDHSILSQKHMLEELRQLGQQEQLFAEAAN